MAISTTAGGQIVSGHSWGSVETMTHSTATALQTLSLTTTISVLGGGTATGDLRNNLYLLPTSGAVEGQEKWIFHATATGEAAVLATFATGRQLPGVSIAMTEGGTGTSSDMQTMHASATGALTFDVDDDFARLMYMNGKWHIMEVRGASQATASG